MREYSNLNEDEFKEYSKVNINIILLHILDYSTNWWSFEENEKIDWMSGWIENI